MGRVSRLLRLPTNMGLFIAEMAEGIRALYGEPAYTSYMATAQEHFGQSIVHPQLLAFGGEGASGAIGGLLFALRRDKVAQITCVHVLQPFRGQAIETALVREAVQTFRAQNVEGILCEFVPLGELDLERAFAGLDFSLAARELMRAPLDAPGLSATSDGPSRAIGNGEVRAVAKLIADAYEGHPGRLLHAEVRDVDGAVDFVELALQGGYGTTEAAFNRCIVRDGRIVATIIACLVAPDTGFILQVVTHPLWRKRGLAGQLIRDCASAFRKAGADRMALGVTSSNPARNLYLRMGFHTITPVEARYWWRV